MLILLECKLNISEGVHCRYVIDFCSGRASKESITGCLLLVWSIIFHCKLTLRPNIMDFSILGLSSLQIMREEADGWIDRDVELLQRLP